MEEEQRAGGVQGDLERELTCSVSWASLLLSLLLLLLFASCWGAEVRGGVRSRPARVRRERGRDDYREEDTDLRQ